MSKYALIVLVSYLIGVNAWAYPTIDGVSFGFGQFGYHHQWSD